MTLTHDWSSVEVAMIIQDECCHFSLKKCCTLKYNLSKKILVKSSSVFGWFTSVWTAWNLQLWRKTKTCSALGALSWEGAAAKLTVLTTAIQGEAVVSKRSQRLSARLSDGGVGAWSLLEPLSARALHHSRRTVFDVTGFHTPTHSPLFYPF